MSKQSGTQMASKQFNDEKASVLNDATASVIGPGVYKAARGISYSINSRGSGATNTITHGVLLPHLWLSAQAQIMQGKHAVSTNPVFAEAI